MRLSPNSVSCILLNLKRRSWEAWLAVFGSIGDNLALAAGDRSTNQSCEIQPLSSGSTAIIVRTEMN